MIFVPFSNIQQGFYVIFKYSTTGSTTGRVFELSNVSCDIDWEAGTTSLSMNNPATPISFENPYTGFTSQASPFPNSMTQLNGMDISFTRSLTRLSGSSTTVKTVTKKYYLNGTLISTVVETLNDTIPASTTVLTNNLRMASFVNVKKDDIIMIEIIESI